MRPRLLASVGIASIIVLATPAIAVAAPVVIDDNPGGVIAVDAASASGSDTLARTFEVADSGFVDSVTIAVNFHSSQSNNCDAAIDWNQQFGNELAMTLVSPEGTEVPLVNFGTYASGNLDATPVSVRFDDAATSVVGDTVDRYPVSGTLQPVTPLAAVAGEAAQGTWTLRIADADAGAAQCYLGASLNVVTDAAVSAVTIAASTTAVPVGGAVAFSSVVSGLPADVVPTGAVEYFTGSTSLGVVTLVNGAVADTSVRFDAPGSFPVVATYSGDQNFPASVSAQVVVTVNAAVQPKVPVRVETGAL